MRRKQLLVIPHFPSTGNITTRGESLARGLAVHFNVSLLSWREPPTGTPAPLRLLSRFAGLTEPLEAVSAGSIQVVTTPLLYARRLDHTPVRRLNTRLVRRVVERLSIDVVLNELVLIDCERLGRPYFLDIVDLPSSSAMLRWRGMAARASGVITITDGIRDELRRAGLEAGVIGNGADLARFREARGEGIRESLGLGERFVISYVGNHAEWSGLLFLLDVFKDLKSRIPNAALLVVGPGSEIPKAKEKVGAEGIRNVIFTGPVPVSEVAEYFAAADLGVLPFERDPHANLSFPIKVIEYNAARKIVVATPLVVLQKIALPGVVLVERKIGAWVDQIVRLSRTEWDQRWDASVEEHDWRRLADQLAAMISVKLPISSSSTGRA